MKLEADAAYHCVSRVVDKRFIFGPLEKNVFRSTMRKLEEFCGVQVLTYCLMSNHFHILVRVPDKGRAAPLTEERLLELLPLLYDETQRLSIRQELDRAKASSDPSWHREILGRYEARRHDLSAFMRELKQRFTLWYNRSQGRRGTLWEEKFRSVLVEDLGSALMTVAAYVDLNPVRAGLVKDPMDYRWSGYADAVAGEPRAREGICGMLRDSGWGGRKEWTWAEAAKRYRLLLYDKGEDRSGEPHGAGVEKPEMRRRRGVSPEAAAGVRAREGELSLAEALRCRVRYFTDGGILGSAGFVEEMFLANRERFGPKRESGARRMRGADWGALRVLRDLQKAVMGR
jgi:putative transposase